ncbi:MAG: hypothetical protein WKF46_11105, partial [Candidatus Limnocylindrales bacterium]
ADVEGDADGSALAPGEPLGDASGDGLASAEADGLAVPSPVGVGRKLGVGVGTDSPGPGVMSVAQLYATAPVDWRKTKPMMPAPSNAKAPSRSPR